MRLLQEILNMKSNDSAENEERSGNTSNSRGNIQDSKYCALNLFTSLRLLEEET